MLHVLSLVALMIIAGSSLAFVTWSVSASHIKWMSVRILGAGIGAKAMIEIVSYAIETAPNGMFVGLLLATCALTAAILCYRCFQLIDSTVDVVVMPITELSKRSLDEQAQILRKHWPASTVHGNRK